MKISKQIILKILAIVFIAGGTISILVYQQCSTENIQTHFDLIQNKQDTINRIDNRIIESNKSWDIATDNTGKIILYNEIQKLQDVEIRKAYKTQNAEEIIKLLSSKSNRFILDTIQNQFREQSNILLTTAYLEYNKENYIDEIIKMGVDTSNIDKVNEATIQLIIIAKDNLKADITNSKNQVQKIIEKRNKWIYSFVVIQIIGFILQIISDIIEDSTKNKIKESEEIKANHT